MAQLTPLKHKILSVRTTKKITHAIRLVAMSTYSKLEKKSEILKLYKDSINQTFNALLNLKGNWTNKILLPNDPLDQKPLYIFVSSGKGLCGSFNSNLIRYINRTLITEKFQSPDFIFVGSKIKKEIMSKQKGKTILELEELTNNNLEATAEQITEVIYNYGKNYSSVHIYSNNFKSFFAQYPFKTKIIPAELNISENSNFDPIFEQDKYEILNYIGRKYIKTSIQETLFQSLIAENASRFLAMDSSNNNANKMLEKLILQYNKSRQALITMEVSELAANM